MAKSQSVKATAKLPPPEGNEVDAFLESLDHPRRDDIVRVRQVILSAAPGIVEEVKWNAPSFRTTEYFATTNLRARAGIGVILHLGAKARALPPGGLAIDDPEGLLKWLAADRAQVDLGAGEAFAGRAAAFQAVLRQWIRHA